MNHLNPTILALLRQLEGLPGSKPALHAYRDQGGVLTIGYGHTGPIVTVSPVMPLTDSTVITEGEAEQLLRWDALDAASAIDKYVDVTLNDNQYGALICFVFNEGIEAFRTSTLRKLINVGDFTAAAQQFDRWVYSLNQQTGKKEINHGLQNRRTTEKALFLTPVSISDEPKPQTAPTYGAGQASAPPTNVAQTKSGRAQIGALVTGTAAALVEGVQQVQPIADSTRAAFAMSNGLPHWASYGIAVLVVVSISLVAWGLWQKHREMRGGA